MDAAVALDASTYDDLKRGQTRSVPSCVHVCINTPLSVSITSVCIFMSVTLFVVELVVRQVIITSSVNIYISHYMFHLCVIILNTVLIHIKYSVLLYITEFNQKYIFLNERYFTIFWNLKKKNPIY